MTNTTQYWTRDEREAWNWLRDLKPQDIPDDVQGQLIHLRELRRILATVEAQSAVIARCVNRLRNQGGGISDMTYKLNMAAVEEAEALLAALGEKP